MNNFNLPHKWAVRVTPENADILSKWKIEASRGALRDKASFYNYIESDGGGVGGTEYAIISWYQFQKYVLKLEESEIKVTDKNSKTMQNTDQPKSDRIVVTINKNNEIETSKNGSTVSKVTIMKETTTTRTIKINGVERDLSVSVIVDEKWNIHAGYAIRNPKWDKENNPELAKTVARNRAINSKTNLLKNEAISIGLASKYVLKGIAEQIFANVSKGIIQIKGVK